MQIRMDTTPKGMTRLVLIPTERPHILPDPWDSGEVWREGRLAGRREALNIAMCVLGALVLAGFIGLLLVQW